MKSSPGKRFRVRLLLTVMFFSSFLPKLPAQQSGIYDGFQYVINGPQAILTAYVGGGGAVTVPTFVQTIQGFTPVFQLNPALFKGKAVTSVAIPGIPVIIGDQMFSGCGNLVSVSLPPNLPSIAPEMFFGCRKLASITIPQNVTSIGTNAFADCEVLTSVSIPDNVTAIGASTFSDCAELISVRLPNGLTTISDSAFSRCRKLASIVVPESVTTLGESVFRSAVGLTSAKLPSSLTSIPPSLFFDCRSLASVNVPARVTSIGATAFTSCSKLQGISFPAGLASIGSGAFSECHELTGLGLPTELNTIGSSAFSRCGSLQTVTIPATVTTIGSSAFAGCSSLQSITVAAENPNYRSLDGVLYNRSLSALVQMPAGRSANRFTVPSTVKQIISYAFFECGNLIEVSLPDGLNSLDEGAFYRCQALTHVTIPATVVSMKYRAFADCSRLAEVVFEGKANNFSQSMDLFTNAAPDFSVYFYPGDTGFTAPTWSGYASMMISRLSVTGLVRNGSTVTVSVTGGMKNWNYGLEFSPNLGITPWAAVSSLGPLISSGPFQLSHVAALGASGYYRVTAQAH